MLWILFSCLSGFMLIKWTREPYRAPVMFFLTLTQVFLLSMIAGWHSDFLSLGASPFRTIAEEMPNAPFIQANFFQQNDFPNPVGGGTIFQKFGNPHL